MDYFFDPYYNYDEPFYSIKSYGNDDPIRNCYGFYFSKERIGVQRYYRSVILWFEWNQFKKILNEKELFLIELMRKTGLSLFNDLLPITQKLHTEINLFVKSNHTNQALTHFDSVDNSSGKIYLHHIKYKWIDTGATLRPETYFVRKEKEEICSKFGMGTLIDPEGDVICNGIFTLNYDNYIYPITADISAFGLKIPVEFLDDILSNNL